MARASDRADCELSWLYLNSDGSTSDMCGNGLRCLALWARKQGIVKGDTFSISTSIGAVEVKFLNDGNINVDLGQPVLESDCIPITGPLRAPVLEEEIIVSSQDFYATCLSMGNPHCVVFEPDIEEKFYGHYAPLIQKMDIFPEGINVEFVKVKSAKEVEVYVFERGCGATLACASGAAAGAGEKRVG